MDEVVRLKAKVYENNVLDKYEAVGTISGESYYLSIDQVKLLASRNLVYGVKLDSKHNKLYGTKEDLRKLKRVNKKLFIGIKGREGKIRIKDFSLFICFNT